MLFAGETAMEKILGKGGYASYAVALLGEKFSYEPLMELLIGPFNNPT